MAAPHGQILDSRPATTSYWAGAVVAVFLTAFFLHFTARAIQTHFAADEMMNIYGYWSPGAWKVAQANVTFWSKFYRPMAGIYYLPLFTLFGLHSAPFNAVRLAILLLNTIVFYLLARRLTGTSEAAALSTLPVAYHAGVGSVAYVGSMIYDVLCGGFFFCALLYYVKRRQTEGALNLRQSCIFLALYICALNSKEMAVSLPVIVCMYELLYGTPARWKRAPAVIAPLLAAIAITVIVIAGKTLGPGALTATEAYQPVFTWARFFESNIRFLNTIFYTNGFTAQSVILAWVALLGLAILTRDRRLLLLWVWVIVSPLPIAFLPFRGGGCLYIVMAGWALAAAILIEMLARSIAAVPILAKIPTRVTVFTFFTIAVVAYSHETSRNHAREEPLYLHRTGVATVRLIQQLRELPVHPAHGSKIMFLNDPFPNGWDTYFTAALWWRDRSLEIWLQNQSHLSDDEISSMNYIFDFSGGGLRQVKP